MHCAIRYFSDHHFAYYTNLLNYKHSVKRMNKEVNQDIIKLASWLNANKIWQSICKTEVVLFTFVP